MEKLHLLRLVSRPLRLLGFFLGLAILPSLFYTSWDQALANANSPAKTNRANQLQAQGREAFLLGDFARAAVLWQDATDSYRNANMVTEEINALILLADAYQALGQHPRALEVLHQAEKFTENIQDNKELLAIINVGQGSVSFSLGNKDKAKKYYEQSIEWAKATDKMAIEAVCRNNLGNILTIEQEYGEALDSYDISIKLARSTGNKVLTVNAMINAAKTAVQWNSPNDIKKYLKPALRQTRKLEDCYEKAYGLAALGRIAHEMSIKGSATASDRWRLFAFHALTEASETANRLGDLRAKSYSLGYLARLYEDEKRYDDALRLTHQAIFIAQQVNAPEILYLWQWQIGRLLKTKGKIEEALVSYRDALKNLETVRQDLSVACRVANINFREQDGRLYMELADLLLKRADSQTDSKKVQTTLREVRDTVDHLRAAELRDYFQDQCVTALQKKETQIEGLQVITRQTAAIYPIIFPERLELLLELPDGSISQFVVNVTSKELKREADNFRKKLEKQPPVNGYQAPAQKLYEWLIKPLQDELTAYKIDTLVFVPDGSLRTIPMAALYDGSHFLITQYAVAIMPSRLSLVAATSETRKKWQPLLGGRTDFDGNRNSLPKVADELADIKKIYGGTLLLDEDFTIQNMEQKLKHDPYTIVHLATHGEFQSDMSKSYLLTYDGKLTMDDLERLVGLVRFRDIPVDLLTLSACQTAAGDDRAALGLAGIAVKSGAQSAIATLWSVNDEATSILIPEFYKNLKNLKMSKAEALRQAQLKMLTYEQYKHPGYWSAFLLTGSWL